MNYLQTRKKSSRCNENCRKLKFCFEIRPASSKYLPNPELVDAFLLEIRTLLQKLVP